MSVWKSLVEGFFGSLWSFIDNWFKEQRAKENDWLAKTRSGQLESIKKAKKIEDSIKKAVDVVKPSTSVSEWNKKAKTAGLLFLVLCLLPGCFRFYVYVNPKMPIIPVPERPTLPENPPEFTEREQILVKAYEEVRAAVDCYNEQAAEHNEKAGY